jgi:hypothetical protein
MQGKSKKGKGQHGFFPLFSFNLSTAEAVERAEKTLDGINRIEAKTLKFITCHAGQE